MTALENDALTAPRFDPAQCLSPEWTCLPAWLPIPGMGSLAANTFLLHGSEPMLVDTGVAALRAPFLAALAREIDLPALRWIWLSHADPDHIGNLGAILERAPQARVVTTFLGAGKLGLMGLDPTRAHVVEPGDTLTIGDHALTALRPPYYDAPESLGFFDRDARVLFAVDSFGAVLPSPAGSLSGLNGRVLERGLRAWSELDAPWLKLFDRDLFQRSLGSFEQLEPSCVLTSHAPPALNGDEATQLFRLLNGIRSTPAVPA